MKIAIVTGASSGIGKLLATGLEAHAAFDELWVIARGEEKLKALQSEVKVPVRAIPLDLTKAESVETVKALLAEEKPAVSVLINASGYGVFERFDRIPEKDVSGMTDLNCRALALMMYAVLPYCEKGSVIVNIASVAAFQPVPFGAEYAATKAYVLALSRAVNKEMKPRGIRVLAVCPYWTKTAFFDETAKKLLGFSDELERNNYIEAVASKYGVPYETLRRKVNQLGLALGGTAPKPKPRELSGQKKPKEEGTAASQKLLLTWAVSDPGYFRAIRRYISPEDFTVPLYREIAGALWEQQEKGQLNPAGILSRFENAEEQREAAAVFNAVLKKVETREEMEKALQESVFKVKQDSLNRRAHALAPSDMEGLQKLIGDRRALEKLHISLD